MTTELDPLSAKWSKCLDLLQAGRFQEVITHTQELLEIIPGNPNVLSVLAIAYEYSDQDDAAIDAYKQALQEIPHHADNHEALARIYSKQGKIFEAIEANQATLQYNPKSDIAHNNLGSAYGRLGDIDNAIHHLKQALELNPKNLTVYENLLFYYNCSTQYTLRDAHQLSAKYYQALYSQYGKPAPRFNLRDYQHKKLRIGFLSADFNHHPVGYFLHSIFEEFDKNKLEIFCYYNSPLEDQMTELFRGISHKFIQIDALSDNQTFDLIYKDKPNILIETIGFTNRKRMSVIVRKPAPVIASYLGYFATTGIREIDYLLVDSHVVKPEEEQFFSEKIYHISDCYMHANPYGQLKPVQAAPHQRNGYITIGSFSTLRKINDEVIHTWSAILRAAPNAKLLLRTNLQNEQVKQYIVDKFARHSITSEQLLIKNFVSHDNICDAYAELDIALDPFPYGGGVTSIEAMMMGVPMISWYGPIIMSRVTASMLQTMNYPELVANTLEDYVSKAVALINDPVRINQYRAEIRERMLKSNLHIKSFTRNLETSLTNIWNNYVRTQTH